jgi:ubiquinone/menaquinone biosynthesis C-methylase UbiE
MRSHIEPDRGFTPDPFDPSAFTRKYDVVYSRYATAYDRFVKLMPPWRRWLDSALPHVVGPQVLEVSTGTGYLQTKLAPRFETHGVDLNKRLLRVTQQNLEAKNLKLRLSRANVEALPYPDDTFDTVVNTMAFTAYPDAHKAMGEMLRVLRSGGKLIIVDVNYPKKRSFFGTLLVRGWIVLGDVVRNMDELFRAFELDYTDSEVGSFGTIHLYIAEKP